MDDYIESPDGDEDDLRVVEEPDSFMDSEILLKNKVKLNVML